MNTLYVLHASKLFNINSARLVLCRNGILLSSTCTWS